MTTILQAVQEACKRCGLPSPSTAVANTDSNIVEMVAFFNNAGKDLRSGTEWPEMVKEFNIELVSGTAAYAFPADLDYQIFQTVWNRDSYWPIYGPITPQQWQVIKSGSVGSVTNQRFRVKGWQSANFYIDPTPGASEAGQELYIEYASVNWLRPTTAWTAGASIATTGLYRYYGDNVYVSASTGTTGATAPTHMAGTVSDGSVNWTFTTYQEAAVDTDIILLDSELVIEGMRWRWKREKGLAYSEIRQDCEIAVRLASTNLKGAQMVNFCRRRRNCIGSANIPEGNWPDS
jgi:hypothetical protein